MKCLMCKGRGKIERKQINAYLYSTSYGYECPYCMGKKTVRGRTWIAQLIGKIRGVR